MTPGLSQSTAEDDLGERDTWPTSRMGPYGRYGPSSSSSSGPSTPETAPSPENGPTPKSKLTAAALEEQDRTPLRIIKTSDHADSVAEDESTSATTTARRPSLNDEAAPAFNKARSEADAGDSPQIVENDDDGLQYPTSRQRTSSCSISTPISPSCMPFFGKRSAPAGASIAMATERSKYVVLVSLPGFSLNCITLATKRNAHDSTLHVVADKWDAEGGGHFERRVHFSEKDCDLANVKAEFDGNTLRVTLPRKSKAGNLSSSSSSVRF
uniref:SHSP domain-containing protein n=2 Tax=Kalmanozyma brasiliensis (strain GHG001) TaxID=1365824 RepID=V5ELT4_KALBG